MGEWNKTIISLIPKVSNPVMIKEFRPISLCNVCYKIIARALTNRPRPMMKLIVNDTQSAFVPGRQITDNIILGFEAVLKLDMIKAYDRVEWSFLEAMMGKLGFSSVWTEKVMRCVSSVKYSFSINYDIVGNLTPSRGIRQGDPLSPYLFTVCVQELSSMLSNYENRGLIKGVKIANTSPVLPHLFFADDS